MNGIGNGFDPVFHGDDDRGFYRKWCRKVYGAGNGRQPGADLFQMLGAGLLHFQLYVSVFRIDIIELFFARCSKIGFRDRV